MRLHPLGGWRFLFCPLVEKFTFRWYTTKATMRYAARKLRIYAMKPASRVDNAHAIPRGPWNWIFLPLALLYHELLLRAMDAQTVFFSGTLVLVALFAAGTGLLLSFLVNLLRHRHLAWVLTVLLTAVWTVLLCVEYCCRDYFKSYFSVGFICSMTRHVVTGFGSTIPEVVLPRLAFILLAAVPLVLGLGLRRRIAVGQRMSRISLIFVASAGLLLALTGEGLARWGAYSDSYTYNYQTDTAVTQFGLHTAVRLEAQYALLGTPQPPLSTLTPLPTLPAEDGQDEDATTPATPVVYGYNALDIDFDTLAATAEDSTLRGMAQYFGALTPSKKNEYTGAFAGKNLVLITAEAFSPWFISEELTPTLYRLTHEGFVCTNYYQPGWGQSTTGGEYAVMTGLLPTWIGSNVSFYASAGDAMPFALGNQLRAQGYATGAYHDNIYNYYGRDRTHPNLGYDYQGVGSGLSVTEDGSWPYSDLEMVQNTIGSYIDGYVSGGTPFHVYYMTVSGHGAYGWGHAMASKNRERAESAYPDASRQVQAYVAANLELENALAYLVDALEKAGIAEDTVICLSADHYPYLLAETETDYYNELRGVTDTERDTSRYENALILWCGGMEEAVTVDVPCSAVDIVPTLSNLFGLDYDSRLLSGRDILDSDFDPASATGSIPLVILPTASGNSWRTAAGTYSAYSRTFTPAAGVTVEDGYVSAINNRIALQYNYAKLLIERDFYRLAVGG